jgi:hypothetical protein
MSESVNTALQNALADEFADHFNGGTLLLLKGARAGANAAETAGNVCVTINLPDPCHAAAAGGSAEKDGAWTGTAGSNAGGGSNITWGRFKSADGLRWHDVDVAITGTGGTTDLELDNPNVATGQVVTIAAYEFTQAAS